MAFISPYYYSVQKRVFDLSLATVLMFITLPIFIVAGLSIWLTSGWPIFFLQARRGQYQKSFKIWKFRSMYLNAEKDRSKYLKLNQAPAPMFKITDDPRFTGPGKWLSLTGLDELPQLINIFKNEMSLVGPRPLPLIEAAKLPKSWDFRYQVKPGIFSFWAIDEHRWQSLTKWKALEIKTLAKGSLISDVKLILIGLSTLFAPFRRRIKPTTINTSKSGG